MGDYALKAVADPGGHQHTILPKFPKNCMKLKEFGPQGEGARISCAPLRSATAKTNKYVMFSGLDEDD